MNEVIVRLSTVNLESVLEHLDTAGVRVNHTLDNYVCMVQGMLAGYFGLEYGKDSIVIKDVWIREDFKGKGILRLILQQTTLINKVVVNFSSLKARA